jgi:hypothetical protein
MIFINFAIIAFSGHGCHFFSLPNFTPFFMIVGKTLNKDSPVKSQIPTAKKKNPNNLIVDGEPNCRSGFHSRQKTPANCRVRNPAYDADVIC